MVRIASFGFSVAAAALALATTSNAALLYVSTTSAGVVNAFSSLEDMAAGANATALGSIGSSLLATDGVWTDGSYVYKTTADATGVAGSYNNLYVRYSSLAALGANSGGTTFNMVQGMYYNEDVVANTTNGWFFRTASFGGGANVGMYAFNDFGTLLANNNFYASGFTGGDQNGDNKYWAGTGSTCWRSNVQGGVVTSFSVFASGPDLYNNIQSLNVGSNAGYDANTRFMTIDSSLIPAPGAIALLAVAGVGISRRRRA
ncbi:MAG: hypothetical protein RL254_1844 [Planctomycetota bacterium]|jgi:hypothetical protein